jgi:DNA-binding response OmpR family regulator
MKIRAGILSQNSELIESAKENASFPLSRYHNFDYLKADEFDILLIDAEYFEGEESIQFFLSRIRKKLQGTPVILVTKTSMSDAVDFEWFFDDFILYPFRKTELDLRIRKLSPDKPTKDDGHLIPIGNLSIDVNEYAVYMGGEKLEFTYKEFELLRLFAQNRGKVFTRQDLLAKIWGIEYIGGTRTVDVHIRRLRCKLGEEFNSIIETVRNVGYRCRE